MMLLAHSAIDKRIRHVLCTAPLGGIYVVQNHYAYAAAAAHGLAVLAVPLARRRQDARGCDSMRWITNRDGIIQRSEWRGNDRSFANSGLEQRRPAVGHRSQGRRTAQHELRRSRSPAESVRTLCQLDAGRFQQPRSQPRPPDQRERVALRSRDVPPRRSQPRRLARPD